MYVGQKQVAQTGDREILWTLVLLLIGTSLILILPHWSKELTRWVAETPSEPWAMHPTLVKFAETLYKNFRQHMRPSVSAPA